MIQEELTSWLAGPVFIPSNPAEQPQLLAEKVGDLLTSHSFSCRDSSHANVSRGILFSLQPKEKMVRTIKGMGDAPNTDFKAAQGHLASAAGRVLTVHSIDPLLLLGYCVTRLGGGGVRLHLPLLPTSCEISCNYLHMLFSPSLDLRIPLEKNLVF